MRVVLSWTSSTGSWGSALFWHQDLLLPPCPSQWTGRRAMLAPPSPLQGSCLAVSRGSATLARLGIVDRIDQEESTTSQESNIYVIIFFLVCLQWLKTRQTCKFKTTNFTHRKLTGMEDKFDETMCLNLFELVWLCYIINSRSIFQV